MTHNHQVPMGFADRAFPHGTPHMCYIYTDEDERKRIIFRFLESGLLNGENVSYFMDINTADEKEHEVALGLDKLNTEQHGHFSLGTAREAYYPTGVFDPDEMLHKVTEFYAQSMDEGYTGARASGEMSWATKGVPGSTRLLEYEARLNSTFMKCPITEICQYNLKRFDNSILRDVLTVHPMVIFKGRILKNPYYIKSWWLLKKYLGLNEG